MRNSVGLSSRLALLGAVGLLAVAGPAQANITNGDFETGNFTGWTLVKQGTPLTTNDSRVVVGSVTLGPPATQITHTAQAGNDFALLRAGAGTGSTNYTTLTSQAFSAGAGQTLSGFAFFQANGILVNNDDAYVQILQGNHILFSSNVATVGVGKSTPWTAFSYDFTGVAAQYTIQAGIRNNVSTTDPSALGLDSVSLGITHHGSPATPEGSSLFMLIAGGLPFAAVPLLRRKRK